MASPPSEHPHGCKGCRRRDQGAALCMGNGVCTVPPALSTVRKGKTPWEPSLQRAETVIWFYSLLLLQLVGPPFPLPS